ncbi:hypothetical protein GLOIN_2v1559578 [Rhizophagus irregularis DAOM 181602=DAOM 197198]|uniref:F-box domain-containing protein n=1 Tax=Rhizophagus irregularis (strain DAOM 181602 / DAOM 197198 / MUCL 43194) TaxID=747089 RepID=A0A2P4QEH3_RHIID|nr:hypothetical protein GLOIN_2v1559578 [Rhizophagus irregularis DAOM 181602=DAOM 197198]POG76049.1 hypothetical protein GLOIN_2v1559578 [Rhizophagus irregularis DAOM 181602=DAOM 197198]|eukprot:XP_025182915.1 hypothetical protein GLOIN_2v1559578 [Rhizophagus irregularis DAOM 181602=DAOM 197198]
MLLLNFFKKKKNENNVGNSKTLPPELIRSIVLHLKNDKKSLHSCLLVSRDWCKETLKKELLKRKAKELLLIISNFYLYWTCMNYIVQLKIGINGINQIQNSAKIIIHL